MSKCIVKFNRASSKEIHDSDLFLEDFFQQPNIKQARELTDQIFIKAQRIRSLQTIKAQKIEETQDEEFIGIINYSLMALIQLKLGVAEVPDLILEDALIAYDLEKNITFNLMLAKNHDYGEAWREMRVTSLTDLIIQKLLRVKQIEDNQGKTIISEGVSANYMDIINYSIFALIHLNKN